MNTYSFRIFIVAENHYFLDYLKAENFTKALTKIKHFCIENFGKNNYEIVSIQKN